MLLFLQHYDYVDDSKILNGGKEARRSPQTKLLEFARVLKALKQGCSLTLTYRNKPVARIVPIEGQHLLREDDPIYHMYEMAEAIGGPVTNKDIDRLVYGG